MSDAVLKTFEADDLRPAETTAQPAVGDLVEFWLLDGSAGAIGRVHELLLGGWIKVVVDGIGNFAVAPGRATVKARAH
ncbi:MAG TPA: hypothetical protein VNX29_04380 [Kaistia sp.]|nr:hypothetical protein [Kaistia sp.]